ncbi:MAG: hypothetical protein QOE17_2198 [Gaiellales bacterium]|nr:hypothetical protein [Gaiellales bacterium]
MIARHPFAAWAVVGILLGFALTPLFVVTLPLAIVGMILIRRRAAEPDDMLGVLCGMGLVFLLIPSTVLRVAGVVALVAGIALHAAIGRLAGR